MTVKLQKMNFELAMLIERAKSLSFDISYNNYMGITEGRDYLMSLLNETSNKIDILKEQIKIEQAK